ncbi:MAG: 1-deoxy-D-xylulose-5-phosphate reductoisomerase, partial [Burkholderiaceae bacterium]
MKEQRVCVLGSTGSIGVNTLDVISRHPDTLSVYALSAHSRIEQLAGQAADTGAKVVIVPDEPARARFKQAWAGT